MLCPPLGAPWMRARLPALPAARRAHGLPVPRPTCRYCMFLIISDLGNFLLPATRGAPFLDPKFAQEHDERISFGHRARVQQPERARNQHPGRLPGRQPARAHASNRNRRAHPARSQNSDRACTQSVGFMHARVDGRPRMRWNGLDCQDGAGCSLGLRNLLRANSSARTS